MPNKQLLLPLQDSSAALAEASTEEDDQTYLRAGSSKFTALGSPFPGQGAEFVRYDQVVEDEGHNVGSRKESVIYRMDQEKCEKL